MSKKAEQVKAAMAESKKNLKLVQTPGSKPAPVGDVAAPPIAGDGPSTTPPKDKGKKPTVGANGLPPLPKTKRAPKKKTPKECECGCGAMTAGGRFIPGHDSKLNAWCLRVERGVIKIADIEHEGIREAVRRKMKAGGAHGAGSKKAKAEADDEDGE
jgi:hypothetical protein